MQTEADSISNEVTRSLRPEGHLPAGSRHLSLHIHHSSHVEIAWDDSCEAVSNRRAARSFDLLAPWERLLQRWWQS